MSSRRMLQRSFAALAATVTAVGVTAVVRAGAASGDSARSVTKVGSVHAGAPRHVVLRDLPAGGATSRGSHPALMRNGRPTGSGLPSRASTGGKAATNRAQVTPHAIANQFNGLDLAH